MDLNLFDGRWLAIQVRSHMEQTVGSFLSTKGYEVLVPMFQLSDQTGSLSRMPLFPSYIFFRHMALIRHLVVTTPGVIRILGVGRTPVPLDDWEIESVKVICRSGLSIRPHGFLRIGDEVEIMTGPLTGARGTVMASKKKSRLVVSISLLQRSVFVELDHASARSLIVNRVFPPRNQSLTAIG